VSSERTNPTAGFWDERTGWKTLKQVLLLEPLPGGSRWAAAFGSLLLFAFLVQVVTGILLAMNYAPSEKTAWESVKAIQTEAPLGALIRAVHHWGSSAMVVLLLIHLVQVYVWGAYKRPRELTWMVGVLLLFCTLGMAFTGYLLPWDQKAYWATKVGLGIASTVPFVGDGTRTLLQGGNQIGNLTLTRFFAIHGFILPGLIIGLVVVHLYLFRRHGVTPPWWRTAPQLKADEEPFWPKQALKDGVFALLFLIGLGLWAYFRPAPLGEQSNPSELYEARPEWYFMFLFKLLSYFKGPYEVVGTFVLPVLFVLILFFWPFLDRIWDRSPHMNPVRRPVAMGLLTLGTAGLIGLTIFAVATDVRMQVPAQAAAKEPAPPEPAGPIQRMDVPGLYAVHCQACHGVDGSGDAVRASMKTIPDFTSLEWQTAHPEVEIAHRIMTGDPPLMPAFKDKLTQPQNLALAIYVRAFSVEPGKATPAQPGQGPPPAPIAKQEPAEQMYRDLRCLGCHDRDGRGGVVRMAMPEIPDFTNAKWQSEHPDAELEKAIVEGKGKFMPPVKDKLDKEDLDKLVAVVRSFKGAAVVVKDEPKEPPKPPPDVTVPPPPLKEPGPAAEERAAQIRAASVVFRQYCVNCHGPDGKGALLKAAMPKIPDFTDRAWQDSHPIPQLRAVIRNGKELMPAFDDTRVSDDQLNGLLAYVRAFAPGAGPAAEAPTAPDDFEQQYRRLQAEWDALQKQMDELSKTPKGP